MNEENLNLLPGEDNDHQGDDNQPRDTSKKGNRKRKGRKGSKKKKKSFNPEIRFKVNIKGKKIQNSIFWLKTNKIKKKPIKESKSFLFNFPSSSEIENFRLMFSLAKGSNFSGSLESKRYRDKITLFNFFVPTKGTLRHRLKTKEKSKIQADGKRVDLSSRFFVFPQNDHSPVDKSQKKEINLHASINSTNWKLYNANMKVSKNSNSTKFQAEKTTNRKPIIGGWNTTAVHRGTMNSMLLAPFITRKSLEMNVARKPEKVYISGTSTRTYMKTAVDQKLLGGAGGDGEFESSRVKNDQISLKVGLASLKFSTRVSGVFYAVRDGILEIDAEKRTPGQSK